MNYIARQAAGTLCVLGGLAGLYFNVEFSAWVVLLGAFVLL